MVRNCSTLRRTRQGEHGAAGRGVEGAPQMVDQHDREARRPQIARRRHLDRLARREGQRAVDAAQRLGEARGGVLGGGRRIGEAAVPGRAAARAPLRQAMDDRHGDERRDRDEEGDDRRIVDAARRIEGDQRQRRRAARPAGRPAPTRSRSTGPSARPARCPAARPACTARRARPWRPAGQAAPRAPAPPRALRGRPRKAMP